MKFFLLLQSGQEFVASLPDVSGSQRKDQVARLYRGQDSLRRRLNRATILRSAVAEVLQKAANMPADDSRAYAAEWDKIYMAAFEPSDIATLKRQAGIFKAAGSLKQDPVEAGFATDAYERSKKIK